MNNSVFRKTMEYVRNHRDIKLVTSHKRRKRLVAEPNYNLHKKISDHLMAIELKKTRVKMTKPLNLGMSILDISKILMYKFWYNYINAKYGDNAKLWYTDIDSFIIYIKTEDFFKHISNDVEGCFDKSNCEKNNKRPLPIGKIKKVPGLFKDELGGKIMAEFVALTPKTYSYIDNYGNEHEESKGTKRCVIKQKLMHQNFKNCLFNNKTVYRSQ